MGNQGPHVIILHSYTFVLIPNWGRRSKTTIILILRKRNFFFFFFFFEEKEEKFQYAFVYRSLKEHCICRTPKKKKEKRKHDLINNKRHVTANLNS